MDFKTAKRSLQEETLDPSIEEIARLSFRMWFQGSKVVDDIGHPLVVYHGSSDRIDAFDESRCRDGIWFSESMDDAYDYGHQLHEVYVAIKKPAYFRRTDGDAGIRQAIEKAKLNGHDGLIVTSPTFDEGGDASEATWATNFIAFHGNQVRHADSIASPVAAR